MKNKQLKGDFLIIVSLIMWWFFPIVTKNAMEVLPVILVVACTTFFSLFYYGFFFIKNKEWKHFTVKKWWKDLFLYTFFLGIVFYLITFYWISQTSSINASIFGLSEIFFSYLIFWILFGKEKSTSHEIWGALCMWIGWLIVLFPWEINVNSWDLIIMFWVIFAVLWNQYSKNALHYFSLYFILTLRAIISTSFLFWVYFLWDWVLEVDKIGQVLPELLIGGILVFALHTDLWTRAYKYISVPRASSFLVLYPLFTMFYMAVFFKTFPEISQLLGLIPIIIWVIFLYNKKIFIKFVELFKK